jgi:hypothetical protein
MKLARAHRLRLVLMNEMMAIRRLGALDIPPAWSMAGHWWSLMRTADELSIVCT